MRTKHKPTRRPGATIVETAIVLGLFVTLLLGMIDLGYGIFRYHVLAQTARRLARHAIVHGSLADQLGTWGPGSVNVPGDDPGPEATLVSSSLVGWKLSEVTLELDWVDGGNVGEHGDRVQVRISAPYKPLIAWVLGNSTITLTGRSTMRIAH